MKNHPFKGTGVALITPFKKGAIDFTALKKIIEFNINGGVDFLVSLGTTGEAITLNQIECQEVLDFTAKINKGRVPLVAGLFGGNNTQKLIDRFNDLDISEYQAVLSSSPSYSKPNQEGIYQHYMHLAAASPLPIIIYNVPGRTSSNIEAATCIRLANASEKFIAIKEASGDINQGSKILKNKPDHFTVLSGDDTTALALISCGAEGVISVIGNAFPQLFSSLIRHAMEGDFKPAQKIHLQLLDLHQWLYVDGNPAGIKAALNIMGFCANDLRLPLVPMSKNNFEALKAEIAKVPKIEKTKA